MKYVPLEKRSKKAQKEFYKQQRGSWLGVDPRQRIVPSAKLYKRNKWKQEKSKADDVPQSGTLSAFFIILERKSPFIPRININALMLNLSCETPEKTLLSLT